MDINAFDTALETPAHYAARNLRLRALLWIFEHGGKLQRQNKQARYSAMAAS
jgi:hypothetical protein